MEKEMKLSEAYRQPDGKSGYYIVSYYTGFGTRELCSRTFTNKRCAEEYRKVCNCLNPKWHFVEVKDVKFNLLEYT